MTVASKRRVAIFTGNRAEYGQLFPIIRAIARHPSLDYRLLVSGAHLQEDFGRTVEEIAKDGFRVDAEIKLDMPDDTLYGTAQAIGTGVISVAHALAEIRPDLVVVAADRFEGLAAMVACTQMGLPTAHVEAGDITEGGALDDSVRHAMSKLAHLHFTTNEEAAERVRRLGEEPWRVRSVGLASLDLVAEGDFTAPADVAARLGLDLAKPIVAFTQHSVTTEHDDAVAQVAPSLEALEALAREGVQVVATFPNNDAGGRRIIEALERFAKRGVPNFQVHRSLGRRLYHGLLNMCGRVGRGACVGNSSSGIKETPAFGCPTVNIGSRQLSRLRGSNVIEVEYDRDAILEATRRCLFDDDWRKTCATSPNPYGAGNAGKQIADVLATVPLDRNLLRKRMTY